MLLGKKGYVVVVVVGKTTNGNILLNLLPLQLRIENTKHVRSSKDRS